MKGVLLASPFPHLSLAMLFVLFVYYSILGDIILVPSIDNHSSDANHYTDLAHCRTIWNIVLSFHHLLVYLGRYLPQYFISSNA